MIRALRRVAGVGRVAFLRSELGISNREVGVTDWVTPGRATPVRIATASVEVPSARPLKSIYIVSLNYVRFLYARCASDTGGGKGARCLPR